MGLLFDLVKNDVELVFNDSITGLRETTDAIEATFRDGSRRSFDLVFGCDGLHSTVRRLCFGSEAQYSHFPRAVLRHHDRRQVAD